MPQFIKLIKEIFGPFALIGSDFTHFGSILIYDAFKLIKFFSF